MYLIILSLITSYCFKIIYLRSVKNDTVYTIYSASKNRIFKLSFVDFFRIDFLMDMIFCFRDVSKIWIVFGRFLSILYLAFFEAVGEGGNLSFQVYGMHCVKYTDHWVRWENFGNLKLFNDFKITTKRKQKLIRLQTSANISLID